MPATAQGEPYLLFAGHTDVVPPGDVEPLAARSVRRRDRMAANSTGAAPST